MSSFMRDFKYVGENVKPMSWDERHKTNPKLWTYKDFGEHGQFHDQHLDSSEFYPENFEFCDKCDPYETLMLEKIGELEKENERLKREVSILVPDLIEEILSLKKDLKLEIIEHFNTSTYCFNEKEGKPQNIPSEREKGYWTLKRNGSENKEDWTLKRNEFRNTGCNIEDQKPNVTDRTFEKAKSK